MEEIVLRELQKISFASFVFHLRSITGFIRHNVQPLPQHRRRVLYRGLISGYAAPRAAFVRKEHIGETGLVPDIAADVCFQSGHEK
jgi:hypothetical protein